MNPEEVKALVEAGFEDADVAVEGGGDRFQIRVVSTAFEGMMPVKKQQLVYATINEQIKSNTIHAVQIITFTPAEWEQAQRPNLS
ncbi:toluene-tolerance protein [Alcanivorax hongdengensis A-11-3]|uniref:Toluene-tolerance protein n=1 Tax=Alcanivorax hongdengensis A-11-3 TaxID=1177179 RepID=L0WAZ3_9GAMM|nr:BolA/IbaG family iron-sulfur metabolism protein [Alcanivorax hongdengensis]EKF74184.1 toluene-tolerance protein [Alcanivorax hongdengensis A-11-3]